MSVQAGFTFKPRVAVLVVTLHIFLTEKELLKVNKR
jgi:hypothetical protein